MVLLPYDPENKVTSALPDSASIKTEKQINLEISISIPQLLLESYTECFSFLQFEEQGLPRNAASFLYEDEY